MVFNGIKQLLKVRSLHSAFSPSAGQEVLDFGEAFFVILRHNADTEESILAIHNVTSSSQDISIETHASSWEDCLTGEKGSGEYLNLPPYGIRWIVTRPSFSAT